MPSQLEQYHEYRFAFSTYEKAKAYMEKIKEKYHVIIIEKELDKPFTINKAQSPYLVEFANYVKKPDHHVYLVDDDEKEVELALKNEYIIRRDENNVIRIYGQYLFASNKKEAIELAGKMRKDVLASEGNY